MGLGLAQLGEFSFLLLLAGLRGDVISEQNYNRTLFIALGTLIATPLLLKFGVRFCAATNSTADRGCRCPRSKGRRIAS